MLQPSNHAVSQTTGRRVADESGVLTAVRRGATLPAILAAEDVRRALHDVAVGLLEVLTAEDVRARLDTPAARESVVLATEDVGPRLDGALGCRRVLAPEDVRMG